MEILTPMPVEALPGNSVLSLTICGGSSISMWSTGETALADNQYALQLAPGMAVVVGSQEGGHLDYLDPAYRSTQLMPGTGQPVVKSGSEGKDTYVSRVHFTLKGSSQGIVFLNGVPAPGGGVRPPTNWTWLLEPDFREIEKGTELLIERGTSIKIQLPNGTKVLIGSN